MYLSFMKEVFYCSTVQLTLKQYVCSLPERNNIWKQKIQVIWNSHMVIQKSPAIYVQRFCEKWLVFLHVNAIYIVNVF